MRVFRWMAHLAAALAAFNALCHSDHSGYLDLQDQVG